MLLVDDDQSELFQRREHRRARAHADARFAAAQPHPLVVALADAERRVQNRHDIAERAWKRQSVCGVSAISGTSTIADRPACSAASTAPR